MEYIKWNNTGYKTSYLGLGCMRFPKLDNGEIDEEHSQRMVDLAIKEGVNYFDTAWFYHDYKSEKFVGKALKKYDRQSYYLATKMPIWEVNTKQEAIDLFNKQLENLQTDYFDTYLVHALSKEKWEKVQKLEVMPFLEEMKAKGVIKSIGFSFHSTLDDFKEIVKDYPWEFCQIQLNYLDIDYQQGIEGLHILNDMNIPIIIMEPLKGGLLSNLPGPVQEEANKYNFNMTNTKVALEWFKQFDNIVTILSGMSHIDHLKENIKTLSDKKMPSKEFIKNVEAVGKYFKSRRLVDCTSCDYCMPCPHGVSIPANFRIVNDFNLYNDKIQASEAYKSLGIDAQADKCIACGECEPKCPQKIQIINDLDMVHSKLNNL